MAGRIGQQWNHTTGAHWLQQWRPCWPGQLNYSELPLPLYRPKIQIKSEVVLGLEWKRRLQSSMQQMLLRINRVKRACSAGMQCCCKKEADQIDHQSKCNLGRSSCNHVSAALCTKFSGKSSTITAISLSKQLELRSQKRPQELLSACQCGQMFDLQRHTSGGLAQLQQVPRHACRKPSRHW